MLQYRTELHILENKPKNDEVRDRILADAMDAINLAMKKSDGRFCSGFGTAVIDSVRIVGGGRKDRASVVDKGSPRGDASSSKATTKDGAHKTPICGICQLGHYTSERDYLPT